MRALAIRNLSVTEVVDRDGIARVRLVLPGWEDFLREAVEDLLPSAESVPMVLERIQRLLNSLLEISPAAKRDPLILLRDQVEANRARRRPASALGPAGG